MATTKHDREYDIVLVGATGYTGKLTARHIAENLPTNLKWAIAGRSSAKLEALAAELKQISSDRLQPEIEPVDVDNHVQLTALVERAKVCVSVVLYADAGAQIIEACIEGRTDYLDTAGSIPLFRQWFDKYHHAAEQAGVALISACGAYSAFQDLLTWASVRELERTSSLKTRELVLSAVQMAADPSGGTINSMLRRTGGDPKTLQEAQQPWYLSPVKGGQTPDPVNIFGIRHDALLGQLSATSISAVQNRAVVHRTWGLLDAGNTYGPNFHYNEYNKVSSTTAGIARVLNGLLIKLVFSIAPLRALVKMHFPKPGEGPALEKERNYRCEIEAVAYADMPEGEENENGENGPKVRSRIFYPGGPYHATAAFLAQGAASLLYTRKLEGGASGGCLTPAFLGEDLVERFQGVGAELSVETL